ncbi:general vesicular transport factor p115 [Anaeramoeba flamelloides]|uniref:General vesicular transport factor p115 n=1 Tax=Anaeramoeba flamelloides TaxID=1746091 RepID=A0ABQ8Z0I1_9EUKA|nr:general vesicular transport factor p115 [Anaeramoeba flamelloides]
MDFFKKFISPDFDDQQYISELIESLNEQKEDHSNTIQELRKFSSKYPLWCGKSLKRLLFLVSEEKDPKKTLPLLESILTLITPTNYEQQIYYENAKEILNDKQSVSMLLTKLADSESKIRYLTIKLLTVLLKHDNELVQEKILKNPNGIPRIIDLLRDRSEVIQNQSILLIYEVIKKNSDIQKIVAFESVFELLYQIIIKETESQGKIVIYDCFKIILTLLSENSSNKNHFRETGCIKIFSNIFKLSSEDLSTKLSSTSKQFTIQKIIEVFLCLLSRHDEETTAPNIIRTQDILVESFNDLLFLTTQSFISVNLKSQLFILLGEIVNEHRVNQLTFSNLKLANQRNEKVTIIDHLINLSFFSTEIELRIASIYTLKRLLKNSEIQMFVAKGLIKKTNNNTISQNLNNMKTHSELEINENNNFDIWKIIISAFCFKKEEEGNETENGNENKTKKEMNKEKETNKETEKDQKKENEKEKKKKIDEFKIYFACLILSEIIKNNIQTKRILLSTVVNKEQKKSNDLLLQQIIKIFILESNLEKPNNYKRIGILILLSIWMYEFPQIIENLLHMQINQTQFFPFLISLIVGDQNIHIQGLSAIVIGLVMLFSKKDHGIDNIVKTYVGIEQYLKKINILFRSKEFMKGENEKIENLLIETSQLNKINNQNNNNNNNNNYQNNKINNNFDNDNIDSEKNDELFQEKSKKYFIYYYDKSFTKLLKKYFESIQSQLSNKENKDKNSNMLLNQQAIEKMLIELEKLKKQHLELGQEANNASRQLEIITQENNSEKKIIENLNNELSKHSQNINVQENEISNYEQKIENYQEETRKLMSFKEQESFPLQKDLSDIKNENKFLKKNQNVLYEKIHDDNQRLGTLKEENSKLKETISNLESKLQNKN